MSKGGPLSEPLSGLVVFVCIPGAAPGTTLAEPTTTLCRASGEERALGKLHYAAAAFPQPLHHHLLGEAGTKFGSARAGNLDDRSSIVERSVASIRVVVGRF